MFFYLFIIFVQALHQLKQAQKNSKFPLHRISNISQLNDFKNIVYYVNATFGTPNQQFQIQIDTGSVTTWVSNATCDGCSYPRFDPNNTYTLEQIYEDHNIKYGSGNISGKIVRDQVSLYNTNLRVQMEFMLTNQYHMTSIQLNGLLGLSSFDQRQNIFERGFEEGLLETSIFGLHLQQQPEQSYILYNNFSQEFLEQVTWVPNNIKDQWVNLFFLTKSVKIYGIYIDNLDAYQFINTQNGNIALVDSGASCILLDPKITQYIMNRITEHDCSDLNSCSCYSPYYPEIKIYLAGVIIRIKPEHYMIKSYDQYCRPCFYGNDTYIGGYTMLGDPALRTFISLFDKANGKVGIYGGQKLQQIIYFQIIQILFTILLTIILCIYFYQFIQIQ